MRDLILQFDPDSGPNSLPAHTSTPAPDTPLPTTSPASETPS